MARFTFRLQSVLRQREREEQSRQRDVAELEAVRVALEQRLRGQQQNIMTGRVSLREQLVGELDAASLRQQAASSISVEQSARRIVLELASLHRRLETARIALVEAMRKRRALELLREKQQDAWRQDERRREDAAQDELAVVMAARKEIDP